MACADKVSENLHFLETATATGRQLQTKLLHHKSKQLIRGGQYLQETNDDIYVGWLAGLIFFQ